MTRRTIIVLFFSLFFRLQSAQGQILFEKHIEFSGTSEGNSIAETSDNGFFIGGDFFTVGQDIAMRTPFVTKIDSIGNVLWIRTISIPSVQGGTVSSVITSIDGSTIAAGLCASDMDGQQHLFVISYDINGNEIRSYFATQGTNNGSAGIVSMSSTRDSGFIVSFNDNSEGGNIIKFDKFVSPQWTFEQQSNSSPTAEEVIELTDGSFLFRSSIADVSFNSGISILTKLSNFGSILWQRQIKNVEIIEAITKTSDQGFVILGMGGDSNNFNQKEFVIKCDSNGSLVWKTHIDALGDEQLNTITELANGDLIAAGSSSPNSQFSNFFGNGNVLIERYHSDGTPLSVQTLNLANGSSDALHIIRTHDDGISLTGTFSNFSGPFASGTQAILIIKSDSSLNGCNMKQGLFSIIPFFDVSIDTVNFPFVAFQESNTTIGSVPLSSYIEGDICDPSPTTDPRDANIALYPNPLPTGESLTVSFDGVISAGYYQLEVLDLFRRVKLQETIYLNGSKQDFPLDVHGFITGLYWVELHSSVNNIFLRQLKLIKE